MYQSTDHEDVMIWSGKKTVLGQLYQSYVYLLDGLLIDTGPASFIEGLLPFYKQHDIRQVVLTHHHEDHSGTAAWLSRYKNVPIYIHSSAIRDLSSPVRLPFYRRKIWGIREPVRARPLSEEIKTERHTLSVLFTPGHSEDHVVFLDQQNGRLFAGDLYLGKKLKYILKHENIPLLTRSIEKTLQYDFDSLYCGHSGVVKNGKKALLSKYQFLTELQGQVKILREQGYSEWGIYRKFFEIKWMQEILTLGEASSRHIIRSILHDGDTIDIYKGEHEHAHHI